jgi:BBSome-interacting protein 1
MPRHVLPKAGLVYSEKGSLTEILCKPKLLPIKGSELLRLEAMEREVQAQALAAAAATAAAAAQAPAVAR